MANRFKNRRFTQAGWDANPILAAGEFGLLLDSTGQTIGFKVGNNAASPFGALPLFARDGTTGPAGAPGLPGATGATGSGSLVAPSRAADTNTIDLTSLAGIIMPRSPTGKTLVNSPRAPTPGLRLAGGGGVCVGAYIVAAPMDMSAWQVLGQPPEVGFESIHTYSDTAEPPYAICVRGAAIDTTAPLIGTPSIANAARGFIDTPITEPNAATLSGTLAGVALTGFGGKTATAVAIIAGPSLRVTLSAPAAYAESGTLAFAAGMVRDTNNNQSVVKPATAVTNNIVIPAPVFSMTAAPPNGNVGTSAPGQYTASNSPTYSVFSGALPAGMTIDPATGAVTGTKTTAATSTWVIRAANAGGTQFADTATQTCVVTAAAVSGSLLATELVQSSPSGSFGNINLSTDPNAALDWRAMRQGASKVGGVGAFTFSSINTNFIGSGIFSAF